MDAYVLTDRVTATKYAVAVSNGQINYVETADAALADPVLKDRLTNAYWNVFISDGQLGIESSSSVIPIAISLTDTETSVVWGLEVYDGQLRIAQSIKFSINLNSYITKTMSLSSGLPA
jgi:hypothetical protein